MHASDLFVPLRVIRALGAVGRRGGMPHLTDDCELRVKIDNRVLDVLAAMHYVRTGEVVDCVHSPRQRAAVLAKHKISEPVADLILRATEMYDGWSVEVRRLITRTIQPKRIPAGSS